MSEALVHIDGFRMDFGDKTVIRDLSFDVARGETFGFLGSNGSGKTTTIRALMGIYKPTGGTLYINGRPFKPEDGDRLGNLGQRITTGHAATREAGRQGARPPARIHQNRSMRAGRSH